MCSLVESSLGILLDVSKSIVSNMALLYLNIRLHEEFIYTLWVSRYSLHHQNLMDIIFNPHLLLS